MACVEDLKKGSNFSATVEEVERRRVERRRVERRRVELRRVERRLGSYPFPSVNRRKTLRRSKNVNRRKTLRLSKQLY